MTISSRRGGAAAEFRAALAERVVAAVGAMGTMPHSARHSEARYFSA